MTNSQTRPETRSPATIRLPSVASVLAALAIPLILLGGITFLSTEPRGYLDRAATQATVGIVMFLVGVACMLSFLVVLGVRSIAQQHADLLQH